MDDKNVVTANGPILLGDHDTRTQIDCEWTGGETICADAPQKFSIESVAIPRDYMKEGIVNDIALITLDRDVEITGEAMMALNPFTIG